MRHSAQFLVDTAGIFGRAESRIELRAEAKLVDMEFADSEMKPAVVDGRLFVDLVLERSGSDDAVAEVGHCDSRRSAVEGVVVTGTASGRWSMPCRRCLAPTQGELLAEILELFEVHPTEGETWTLQEGGIDLGPMLREVALLALPFAPLCRAECKGPAPQRFPTGPADNEDSKIDPRWSVLDELASNG